MMQAEHAAEVKQLEEMPKHQSSTAVRVCAITEAESEASYQTAPVLCNKDADGFLALLRRALNHCLLLTLSVRGPRIP